MFSPVLDCRGREVVLDTTRIVGIINVTADSFSDGGRFLDPAAAIEHGLGLAEEGADMLDVGAESTRPGAHPVSPEQQIARVVPVIEALVKRTPVAISIDTSDPAVMRAAVAAGAGFINDVRALRSEGALEAAAELQVPVCLMHMQGEPGSMQDNPQYDDVVGEVQRFLSDRVFACQLAGIDKARIVVDPGFGFGKSLQHNLELLRNVSRFVEIAPVMVGLSRKSMFRELTGREDPALRTSASTAGALLAAQGGACLIRTHDVSAVRDALRVLAAVGSLSRAGASARKVSSASPWDDD